MFRRIAQFFFGESSAPVRQQPIETLEPRTMFNGTPPPGPGVVDLNFTIRAVADFDKNGTSDLLWRNTSNGDHYIQRMQGNVIIENVFLARANNLNWNVYATGDFNADGNVDLVWRNLDATLGTGANQVWYMSGTSRIGTANLPSWSDLLQSIGGAGDFNDDGKTDILWRDNAGNNTLWLMNGVSWLVNVPLQPASTNWNIVGVADMNNDNKPDILWRNIIAGQNRVWLMNSSGQRTGQQVLPDVTSTSWVFVGAGSFGGDANVDAVWRRAGQGVVHFWFLDGNGTRTSFANQVIV